MEFAKAHDIKIGIHFPFKQSSYKYRDPHLISLDTDEYHMAMASLHKELDYARSIDADYLLFHFPKPMVLDSGLDWEKCRFTTGHHPIDEADYPKALFIEKASSLLAELSVLSDVYGVRIVLELELMNKYLYEGNLLKTWLDQYPNLKLCLDSARLHVQSQIDPSFDMLGFVAELTPYTYLVHLSNICVGETIEKGHHPVLKRLTAAEGWCDIDKFLSVISEQKQGQELKILYEHRSSILEDAELLECYEWVSGYFNQAQ